MFEKVTIDDHVRECVEEKQGAVLLHLDRGRYFSLNGIGAEIWTLVARGESAQQVVDALAARYGQPRERLTRDVQAFLKKLVEMELIRAEP